MPDCGLQMTKRSLARVGARFTSHRTLVEYVQRTYFAAHRAALALVA